MLSISSRLSSRGSNCSSGLLFPLMLSSWLLLEFFAAALKLALALAAREIIHLFQAEFLCFLLLFLLFVLAHILFLRDRLLYFADCPEAASLRRSLVARDDVR